MADEQDEIIKPTPERMRKVLGYDELTETQRGGVVRKTGAVKTWTPLDNLYRNRCISSEQYEAGQKYYGDWWYGFGSSSNVTMKWREYISGMSAGGGLDAAERRVFHQKRFAQVNAKLEEWGVRKMLHWLIITDVPCETIGRDFWGYRTKHKASSSAVAIVERSLDMMARFYGLKK